MQAGTAVTVNGRAVQAGGDGSGTLLLWLRNQLGLRGVRPGCAIGECGACTVLVDGAPTRSCITTLDAVANREVTTPEGLGTPARPDPVQRAFIDEQAAQCGYCINGIVMTVASLTKRPRDERAVALDEALGEHLCRCGTHVRILRAARRALGLPVQSDAPTTAPHDGGCVAACTAMSLPPVLQASPHIGDWLEVRPDGCVEAFTGKVEIGQGIRTAMAQLVAAQLEVSPERVRVRSALTSRSPDEGYTAGSLSVEQGGTALATAAAALRRVLLHRAASRSGAAIDELRLEDGAVVCPDGVRHAYHDLVAGPLDDVMIEGRDRPHFHGGTVGASTRRADLPAKITGAPAYVHDMVLDGMLHARAVLPPTYEARLIDIDVAGAQARAGVRTVVRDGSLVIVIADDEEQAVRAAGFLRRSARWDDPGLDAGGDMATGWRALPTTTSVARADAGADAAMSAAAKRRSATYFRPYQAHGAMGPSCAVAIAGDDAMTVYSHTQGIYPLRREIAAILGLPQDAVVVAHADGPGCYGHNCADDAAALAAVAAAAVRPAPVRLQLSMEDELAWDPFGSPMLIDVEAGLDGDGRMVAWRQRTRTDVHSSRPTGSGDRLIPAWLKADAKTRPWPGPHETGMRNSVPLYDVAQVDSVTDFVRGPLRASALRSLASHGNVFAIESFVDELAEAAEADPVEFRLAHLSDQRSRSVLQSAAAAASWQPRVGPSGRGRGVAICRYKSTKAYVAAVLDADVDVDTGAIAVRRVVVACDAGVVVNPDGLRNQIEGGVVQGLSRALFEEVRADATGVLTRDWTSYRVARFGDIPPIDVVLLDGGGAPPVGAGEASTPVVAPALANAIDDAVGIRLRHLPLTAQQARRRLAEMGDEELSRVLL